MSSAWYHASREVFVASSTDAIADQLAGRAARENLEIQADQAQEWTQSIHLLQQHLDERIPVLRDALDAPGCEAVRHVILEFDFRRRGLRMDCLLIADGALFVLEFKRSKVGRADRQQVMSYAVNLLEFHQVTHDWCSEGGAIVLPILALTRGQQSESLDWPGFADLSWSSLASRPLECGPKSLHRAITLGLEHRRTSTRVSETQWLASPFKPSSSIIDATLSLYGNHDVTAIDDHAAPKAAIDASTAEIRSHIAGALADRRHHLIFLSGAPGAGKTLVGLDLVMRGEHAANAVFVTGNAPLVDVLNKALSTSYRSQGRTDSSWTPTGYRRRDAEIVAAAASFKVVKAHQFLGKRGEHHKQADSRIIVFDEAQRTYEKGRVVLGERLKDHEADLVLQVQKNAFPDEGAVVVALVGQNQAINRGERGIVAWLEAADRGGWTFSIDDKTLALAEFKSGSDWASHPNRRNLDNGHLVQSMRFYRNAALEEWADAVLDNDVERTKAAAARLEVNQNAIYLTRSIAEARAWARRQAIGEHRSGIIASGQARRLAAEGIFVDHKPDIATWMLAPNSDIRSSSALETVQNQYQIQGLELDFCIVCWDLDLRREGDGWSAYKMSGSDWQRDNLAAVAKNSYRVLLTRTRKGLIIFVPWGDPSGADSTRDAAQYNSIANFLLGCGARLL